MEQKGDPDSFEGHEREVKMTNILIVESPNKVRKIEGFLGSNWRCAASVGHIRDLPDKSMGIDLDTYNMTYEVTQSGKSVVERLQKLVAQASQVYLATDPDREGEAISWHLQQTLRLSKDRYQRVTFTAITAEAVTAAIQAPRRLDGNLVRAQEARRALDRLIGYTISPLTERITGVKASAGRVQTPAVRLVDDRELEIQNFKVTNHYGAEIKFDNGAWSATWDRSPFISEDQPYVMDRGLAEAAAGCRDFKVTAADRKPARRAPPAPFTTSTLLQAASISLGFQPDHTQRIAQKLFEGGYITYHRTDSVNFAPEAIADIRSYAAAKGLPLPDAPRRWASKDAAQEAHEAIRPTHVEDMQAGEDEDQKKLYQLIWNRSVACQLADAVYTETKLTLTAQAAGKTFRYKAQGSVLVEAGWKSLTAADATEEDGDEVAGEAGGGNVPLLTVGASQAATDGKVTELKTRPPQRYTQASLIKKLEALGIGRPSTFSSTITQIMKKKYIQEKAKKLYPTEIGSKLVRGLKDKFAFVEYEFTKKVEDRLDDIAQGRATYLDVVTFVHKHLVSELEALGIDHRSANGPRPPSPRQIEMAEKLAAESSLVLTDDIKADMSAISAFIEKAMAARPSEPMSDSQKRVLTKAIEEGKLSQPSGWPDISKRDASLLMDKLFKKSGQKGRAPVAARRKAATSGRRA